MIYSFKPIASSDCIILLLGSMPGTESLRRQQYYGYIRNSFWKIIYDIFNTEFDPDYDNRCKFLVDHKIALWDVINNCDREGSLDSNIKNITPNDFNWFFKKYRCIKYIFFNGSTAENLFKRYILKGIDSSFIFERLPSTSPANTVSYSEKLKKWIDIKKIYSI